MNYLYYIAQKLGTAEKKKGQTENFTQKIGVIAIALAMVVMLFTVATGVAFKQTIRDKIAIFQGHIQITDLTRENELSTNTPIKNNLFETSPELSALYRAGKIKHFQGVALKTGVVRTDKNFEGIVFKGVGKNYLWENFSDFLVAGHFPTVSKNSSTPSKEILISHILSNRLDVKIGEKLPCFFMRKIANKIPFKRNFKVVGIYESGFEQFDRSHIIGDIAQVQKMNHWQKNQVGAFEVFTPNFKVLPETAQTIYEALPMQIESRSLFEMYPFMFNWIALFDNNVNVILTLMIFIGGLSMVIALLALIMENVRTIGLLKTLGMANNSIRKIFIYKSLTLIFRGLLWGNAIGFTSIFIQKMTGILTLDPKIYYVNTVPVSLSIFHAVLLNVGTVVLCMLMLIVPSYLITKISPSKVIRFR